jgi:cob(I)alamin adenosyltransferase
MPRLTRIYTRKGDGGATSLGNRQRVEKDSLRVDTYGTVDELNSWIGMAIALGVSSSLIEPLTKIQNELFDLGADLSFPPDDPTHGYLPRTAEERITNLEQIIDQLNDLLGPLENFILPGGSASGSALHIARTVCRRAERLAVSLNREETIGEFVIPYLNRLSDALFMMARFENSEKELPEMLWDQNR